MLLAQGSLWIVLANRAQAVHRHLEGRRSLEGWPAHGGHDEDEEARSRWLEEGDRIRPYVRLRETRTPMSPGPGRTSTPARCSFLALPSGTRTAVGCCVIDPSALIFFGDRIYRPH